MASNKQSITVEVDAKLNRASIQSALNEMVRMIDKSSLDKNQKTAQKTPIKTIETYLKKIEKLSSKGSLNKQELSYMRQYTTGLNSELRDLQKNLSGLSLDMSAPLKQQFVELDNMVKRVQDTIKKTKQSAIQDFNKAYGTKVGSFNKLTPEALKNKKDAIEEKINANKSSENKTNLILAEENRIMAEIETKTNNIKNARNAISEEIKKNSANLTGKGGDFFGQGSIENLAGYKSRVSANKDNLFKAQQKLDESQLNYSKKTNELSRLENTPENKAAIGYLNRDIKALEKKLTLQSENIEKLKEEEKYLKRIGEINIGKQAGLSGQKIDTISASALNLEKDVNIENANKSNVAKKIASEKVTERDVELQKEKSLILEAEQKQSAINKAEELALLSVEQQKEQKLVELQQKASDEQKEHLQEVKKIVPVFDDAAKHVAEYENNIEKATGELTKAEVKAKTFGKSFSDIASKMAQFTGAVFLIRRAFQELTKGIGVVKELDKSMTQIGIVTGRAGEKVWESFNRFNDAADKLSTTTSNYLNGAKIFYQQGLKTAQVMEMVEATTISAALGETDFTRASETLTAAINGYNKEASEAMAITDKMAAVGAKSAADFNELSTAMEKVAAAANVAGIDFDHLMGFLGKGIETTREAPEAYLWKELYESVA